MSDFSKELAKALDHAIQEQEFEMHCPNCGRKIKFKIPKNRKTVKCRHCGQEITFKSK